ncbi:trifunctional serine/threonine-protein kinase/ATP-binding protein/sensor histidine kinase [Roseofilum casamattae]|uniref:histidine kinase n=1 Tax=Roseofilum casamattae BLCC-M143 TaxID=3022442 RepID=A0ABT7BVH7_9CYAN|nr:AAA family ATPase [Roseofilum casamattae]MDJ1182466.1 AAA family ATPase [Roseofilum casamattae BLCC-M143]
MTIELSGYQIGENIYEGTRTLVYRGTRRSDAQKVVIKLLRNSYPSFSELLQFRNQYAIAKNLDSARILQPLSLERYGNGYVLVMEDVGAISLDKLLTTEELDLERCLDIAIKLADILHELDRERVIHKDIKPANILIEPETKNIKLIDFSIASLLPREAQEIKNFNILEGTLAYIAPEQTGRMNRGIDYRSDFYALGVTLYQLLTGNLPFSSTDPVELVHCHISQQPIPPAEVTNKKSNIEIPLVVSDIVMKLMAKNAEERYQSALGLKFDLENCLKQWKETGKIEAFELATRDIARHFLIPEKLYGREAEVKTLLAAFEWVAEGQSEMMLVAGFSGIGKTAVINEVHKPIVRQRGYFIKGKFDQFNRNIPFSAFVQAFRDLMEQLLAESDSKLAQWQDKIIAALGENGQVIIDVIPELEQLIGKQPPVPELSGSAAQNRFNLLFQKFIQVFTTKEHPLVIFLDDLQWADSASLNLMQLLTAESQTIYLLLLGAYRNNEVFPAHPLMLTLEEIVKLGASIKTITLEPLSDTDLNGLVAETLSCSREVASPLTELIYQKTKGNPFFATQFLKGLYEDGFITFDRDRGYWFCDMIEVQQSALTDDVVEFMVSRLHKLPEATQEILKLAACIGNQFNSETLSIINKQSQMEVAADLWEALQEGLVLPIGDTYKFFQENEPEEKIQELGLSVTYKFLHDRVQQAAYSLIPEEQGKVTHLQIGQLLLGNYQKSERDDRIFDIVNQLNIGRELILRQIERNELARLNLQAGNKAKASTAYNSALEYLKTGIELLASESWQTEYKLTLALYTEATESSYLNAEFEAAENYSDRVLEQVEDILDAIKIYDLKIQKNIAEENAFEALEIGLQALNCLGMSRDEIIDYGKVEILLPTIEELEKIPEMTDPYQLALMQLLVSITTAALSVDPELLSSVVATQVHISLASGNSNWTAFSYAWYGAILCADFEYIEKGDRSAKLAMYLLEKFETASLKSQVFNLVYQLIEPWKNHLNQCLIPLLDGFKFGIENGDLIYASYNSVDYCINLLLNGHNLEDLLQKQTFYIDFFQKKKIGYTINIMNVCKQFNLNLQGMVEDVCKLTGEAMDEELLLSRLPEINDTWALFILHIVKEILLYLFGDYAESAVQSVRAEEYTSSVGGWIPISVHNLYDSLSLLALYPNANNIDKQQYLKKVAANQEKMLRWAKHAPMNYQHKYDLVEAELHRALDNKTEAIALYDRAIAGAKENGFVQEEALANELAAKFYLDWGFDSAQPNGKEKIGRVYMTDAYYGYSHWGAKAKIDQLEAQYPQLLAPILQQSRFELQNDRSATYTLTQTVSASSNKLGSMLDWATAMKASQSLSSEIHLDKLVSILMKAGMENAGADSGILLLQQPSGWQIAARHSQEGRNLHSIKGEDLAIPTSVINKVKRRQETIIANDVPSDTEFARDSYLMQGQPKSFLCAPLLNQGKLIGIIYLENHLATGAFTSDRVELLSMLCSQAAISLENARLYKQSQDYAQKLENSLADLQMAQLQLVQSEKMSALGNLVAGVAHEINNPVAFIAGNLDPARDYLDDLFRIIDLYQQELPHPSKAIEEEIEAIDLEFLRDDLPQLISSMQEGTDRIRHISTSLRTFSRTDKEYKVPFNVHEGIDSTLLILKHRLKANEERPDIEIIKEYGQLPEVQCFPGQLNQVFMNLIANAIDALDEGNNGRSFDEIAARPNQIEIRTFIEHQQVKICIRDNGTGMPEEVQERIFEQGFTTKGVGKGTGLGMAIALSIIEEKHGGRISCHSELGKGTEFAIAIPLDEKPSITD